MPPKFKNLAADFVFEPRDQRRGGNHDGHAERYRHNRDAKNKPGKVFASGKSDTAGDKKRKIQTIGWLYVYDWRQKYKNGTAT